MAALRLHTGVPHLDEILGGGIAPGAVVLIAGIPGSGKTTLASQIAFALAHADKRALILAAFSESTLHLVEHLQTYRFYDPELVGDAVQILSLHQSLQSGLTHAQEEVVQTVRQMHAEVVVIDGIHGLQDLAATPHELRQFFYNMSGLLSAMGVTTLVTSEAYPRDATIFPEATTADIVLGLHYTLHGVRQLRGIEVLKARGSQPLPGVHAFTLSADGATIYPQLEERVTQAVLGGDAQTQGAAPTAFEILLAPLPPLASFTDERVGFALPGLDALLGGGFPRVTTSVLAGSIGVGKTLLTVAFALAGIRAGEAVVFLSFRETRDQLLRALARFTMGAELHAALAAGHLTHIAVPPIKVNADIIADRLLATLDQTHATRLIIDSITDVEQAITSQATPDRLRDYFAALLTALHVRGVSAILTKETPQAVAPTVDFFADPLAMLAENVVLAQQLIVAGQVRRSITIVKQRYATHSTEVREFRIVAPAGIEILGTLTPSAAGSPERGTNEGASHGG